MKDIASALERGTELLSAGRAADAEAIFLSCCDEAPDDPQAWFMLGAARHTLGRLDHALAAFDRAHACDPESVRVLTARATVLALLDRRDEARETYRRALALKPDDAQVLANIGILCEDAGQLAAALDYYTQALTAQPDHYAALLNRGALLLRLERYDEALEATERLVEAHPMEAEAHFNQAEALLALDRYEEALAACEAALRLQPRYVKAHVSRGLALSACGRLEEATQAFATARALDPQQLDAYVNSLETDEEQASREFDPRLIYLLRAHRRLDRCDWSGRSEYVENFERLVLSAAGTPSELSHRALAFNSLAAGLSAPAHLALTKAISKRIAASVRVLDRSRSKKQGARGKLRIGYVSANFRRHANGYNTRRLYALHDRSRYEVYGYSLQPGDGSEVRAEIERGCDVFRDISEMSDRDAAQRIYSDGIDVLIDLAGYTRLSRTEIMALSPAPVQVSYQGFPGTMGAEFIQYAMVDRFVCPPGAERFWSEQLVYLPHAYFTASGDAPAATSCEDRRAAGLPETGFVFCAFSEPYKIEPRIFEVWMRLLRTLPEAILWLMAGDAQTVRTNLKREAEARGVAGDRLIFAPFLPRERHLARLGFADLFLDTVTYTAHTTAADALWMGVPVLTCPGPSLAGRVGGSLLHALGLPELVVSNLEEYETCAVHLATDDSAHAELRRRLAAKLPRASFFDPARRARELEAAYETMWRRCEAGLPPESFAVAPVS